MNSKCSRKDGNEDGAPKKKSINPDADIFLKAFERKSTYDKVKLAQKETSRSTYKMNKLANNIYCEKVNPNKKKQSEIQLKKECRNKKKIQAEKESTTTRPPLFTSASRESILKRMRENPPKSTPTGNKKKKKPSNIKDRVVKNFYAEGHPFFTWNKPSGKNYQILNDDGGVTSSFGAAIKNV